MWLESYSPQNVAIPAGTFIGKGGPGKFCSSSEGELPAEEQEKAWAFTRITNYKNDSPKTAKGNFVLVRGTVAVDPKMKTLSAIEAELATNVRLWGHTISRNTSNVAVTPGIVQVFWVPATRTLEDAIGPDKDRFSNRTMCTWLPSFEQHAKKKYDLGGLLRPAFEVSLKDSGGAKRLDPSSASSWRLHLRAGIHPRAVLVQTKASPMARSTLTPSPLL